MTMKAAWVEMTPENIERLKLATKAVCDALAAQKLSPPETMLVLSVVVDATETALGVKLAAVVGIPKGAET